MFATGWNKSQESRNLFNYYLVMPFSNDDKAHASRFRYVASSAALMLAGVYLHPISFVYPVILGAIILKEWITIPSAQRIQQENIRYVEHFVPTGEIQYIFERDLPEAVKNPVDAEKNGMRSQVKALMKQNAELRGQNKKLSDKLQGYENKPEQPK